MPEGSTNTTHQPAGADAQSVQQASIADGRDASKTFTQEDVNRLLAAERRTQEQRFADVVTKAKQFDELAEKDKSELQKAVERAEAAEKRAAEFEASEQRRTWASEISAEAGGKVPADVLRGSTREELKAHHDTLAKLLPGTTNSFRDAQGKPAQAAPGDWLRDGLTARR